MPHAKNAKSAKEGAKIKSIKEVHRLRTYGATQIISEEVLTKAQSRKEHKGP